MWIIKQIFHNSTKSRKAYIFNYTFGAYGYKIRAVRLMAGFQEYMEEKFNLYKKTVLFGFSRGGLYAVNYAAMYPEQVSAIYLDAPVLDIKSWPGGFGRRKRCDKEWQKCLEAYHLTDQEASNFNDVPINKTGVLIDHQIPVLLIYGALDELVFFDENSQIFIEKYKQGKGEIQVIMKPDVGHHPHSLEDVTSIVDFIYNSSK